MNQKTNFQKVKKKWMELHEYGTNLLNDFKINVSLAKNEKDIKEEEPIWKDDTLYNFISNKSDNVMVNKYQIKSEELFLEINTLIVRMEEIISEMYDIVNKTDDKIIMEYNQIDRKTIEYQQHLYNQLGLFEAEYQHKLIILKSIHFDTSEDTLTTLTISWDIQPFLDESCLMIET